MEAKSIKAEYICQRPQKQQFCCPNFEGNSTFVISIKPGKVKPERIALFKKLVQGKSVSPKRISKILWKKLDDSLQMKSPFSVIG